MQLPFDVLYESYVIYLTELLAMEAIFALMFHTRRRFAARFIASTAALLAIGVGTTYLFWMSQKLETVFYLIGSFYFIINLLWTAIIAIICFKVSVSQAIFITSAGYALQHASNNLLSIIHLLINSFAPELKYSQNIVTLVISVALSLIINIILYIKRRKSKIDYADTMYLNHTTLIIAVFTIFICAVLSMNVGNIIGIRQNIVVRLYGTTAALFTLYSMLAQMHSQRVQHENHIMEELMHHEKHQHDLNKQTVDIINIKCHDLKHQIGMLETMDTSERKEAIKELQRAVIIYDSIIKTGNDTLDLILTEKNFVCVKYNIKVSYIIDGAELNFIKTADIYSLFGNILDNAIESVIAEPDEAKRLINISVTRKGNIVHIHAANYCAVEPKFIDGLPISTKDDKNYHGFGTKSIKYIAEQYGGQFNCYFKNNKYVLDILFSK